MAGDNHSKQASRRIALSNLLKACTGEKHGNNIGLHVSMLGPLTAFGELETSNITPRVQIDAIYGLRTKTDVNTYTRDGGSVSENDGGTGREFKCSTGLSSTGYARLTSKREVRYRAGQGVLSRFTGRWENPNTSSSARIGLINIGNELTFGYDTNTTFGIFHRRGGRPEIQKLSIDTTTGSEVATINLDGVSYNVTLTAGTAKHAAYELAQASYTGWSVFHNSTAVFFVNDFEGDKTGAFNLTTTGSVVGSFSEIQAGAASTLDFISQSAWNIDSLDGGSSSAFTLDVTKGNVYSVNFQYLGYGAITYFVENPESGIQSEVHKITYANAYSSPSMDIPIYSTGMIVENSGALTSTSLYSASMFGAIEGAVTPLRNPDSHKSSVSNVTATATNILSIRVSQVFQDRLNLSEVFPILSDIAIEGVKPAEISIFLNPEIDGEPDWRFHDGGNQSIVEYDTTQYAVSIGANTVELFNAGLAKSDSREINLRALDIHLNRGDVISLSAKHGSSQAMDVVAGITWLED